MCSSSCPLASQTSGSLCLQSMRTETKQGGREHISPPPKRSYEITGVICVQVCPPSVVFRRNEEPSP